MKKIIISLAIIVVIVGGWLVLSGDKEKAPAVAETSTPIVEGTSGWIDIVASKVSMVDDSGNETKVLATGDLILSGSIIKTDLTGEASVLFRDGSSLRIEPNTTVKITEGLYEEGSGTLKVKVALTSGKVWSKITVLATPESHWEARTGTAVATVRGRAFGLAVSEAGETSIVGSEHDVYVTPIDEETGEELTDATIVVGEVEVLNIKKEDVKKIKALVPEERKAKVDDILVRKARDTKSPSLEWVKKHEVRDTEIKKEQENKTNKETEKKSEKNKKKTIDKKIKKEGVEPLSLDLVIKEGTLKLVEGNVIAFEAVLAMSDGSKKVVTDQVDWQVLGSIGTIKKTGLFRAALGTDVSEIGTAFGAVTASYKIDTQENLVGKSEIITVIGAVDQTLDTRG